MNITLLQINSLGQISNIASKNISMMDIITWVSFATGIISISLGIFAVVQSYHYYKVSSKTNANTIQLLGKLNDIVTRLETVNSFIHDKFLGIFGNTMTKVTNAAISKKSITTTDNLKKDLEKTINDSSDKIDGQIKGLTDSIDKNQLTIIEIKSSLEVVANAIQDVFNNVLNNIDDFDEGSDEKEYLKTKILERCNADVKVTVKDIMNNTSSKISIENKMEIIKKLKNEIIINYEGNTLFDSTVVFMERDLN